MTFIITTESCLGPGDLKVVLKELFVIRPKWRHLGLELDITPSTLDAIEQEYSALEDRLERVLLEWLKKGSATWKMLVEDTLLSPLIGEIMLAQRLRERYCPRGWLSCVCLFARFNVSLICNFFQCHFSVCVHNTQ